MAAISRCSFWRLKKLKVKSHIILPTLTEQECCSSIRNFHGGHYKGRRCQIEDQIKCGKDDRINQCLTKEFRETSKKKIFVSLT